MRFIVSITVVAVVALVAFVVAMIPFFSVDNLFDIPATDAAGSSAFLPFGHNRRKSQKMQGWPPDLLSDREIDRIVA